ncbi:MAG: polysaccharide deacetylase family protein [Anaerolineae bacterium]
MHKKFIIFPIALAALFALFSPSVGKSQEQISCNISIDRSAVPELYFNNLTLLIQVNDSSDFTIIQGETTLEHTRVGANLMVTTQADEISLILTPGTNLANLCDVEKAHLLNDKQWAWTHGFDDNVNLIPAIEAFRDKNWPATIFIIAKDFDKDRQEDWIVDEPFMNDTLLLDGWALGNHSWNHERFETSNPTAADYKADILDGQTRLEAGIARSLIPQFKLMVFAAPNFSSAYDAPFAEATETTDLKLIETGNDFMLVVTGDAPFSTDETNTAQPIAGRNKIGRDISIETNPAAVIGKLDWMANNSNEDRRFWYNTLAHGNHEISMMSVLDYVWGNYGPGGTDEAWVSSSTEVYSYILNRDNATVDVELSEEIPDIPPGGSYPPPETEDEPTKLYLPMITMMRSWLGLSSSDSPTQLPSVLLKVSSRGLEQLKTAE